MNDWEFVGCPARMGHIRRSGPVTGEVWLITPAGVWINADDAYEMYELIEQIWCFRLECMIDIRPVFPLSPSQDQYRLKPTN